MKHSHKRLTPAGVAAYVDQLQCADTVKNSLKLKLGLINHQNKPSMFLRYNDVLMALMNTTDDLKAAYEQLRRPAEDPLAMLELETDYEADEMRKKQAADAEQRLVEKVQNLEMQRFQLISKLLGQSVLEYRLFS